MSVGPEVSCASALLQIFKSAFLRRLLGLDFTVVVVRISRIFPTCDVTFDAPFNKGGTSCFESSLYIHSSPRFELIVLHSVKITAMSFLRLACLFSATALLRVGFAQFNGTITVDSHITNLITITITNEGVHNYSVLAKNNMFDNGHPFQPFSIQTAAGTPVPLAGSRFEYVALNDAQFISFPPSTVWMRQFNVSEFLLPDATLTVATSQCFAISLPGTVPAILVDNIRPDQKLADIFFSGGLIEVPLGSIPLHHNVSNPTAASPVPGTSSNGIYKGSLAAPSATVPAQPSGVISTQLKATILPLKIRAVGQGS